LISSFVRGVLSSIQTLLFAASMKNVLASKLILFGIVMAVELIVVVSAQASQIVTAPFVATFQENVLSQAIV
jgi:nitrogen fixation protein FixH